MKRLSKHSFASVLALVFSVVAPLVLAEPTGQGQSPLNEDQGGRLRDLLRQRIGEVRERVKSERQGYADIVLQHSNELKLSDEQIGKITRLHQANQQTVEDLGKKVRDTLKATHDRFLKPASDEASIRQAAQEHTAAFDALVETALKTRTAINAVLTPEQLQKLKTVTTGP